MTIRVLLVDDVPEVRRLIRTALRFRGGFEVVGEADSGASAIAITAQEHPDVVVLDIGLPDLAGKEVLIGLRKAWPAVRVAVFSGTHPDDSAGIADEVDGYARKDSELDYLIEMLEEIGQQRAGISAVHLPAEISSARAARAFTREVLDRWHVRDIVEDALIVVSEMVTNAVTHANSACELRISLNPSVVRVEVEDEGSGTPEPMPPSTTRSSGRGLHLIGALSAAWGVESDAGGGKTVWAELLRNR